MNPHPAGRLTVKVTLMSEPCLWCWEIIDANDGTLVESSWATEWTGYESSHEAWGAGILRLNELSWRSRGALAPDRHVSPSSVDRGRRLV